jgi:hypothetical protein
VVDTGDEFAYELFHFFMCAGDLNIEPCGPKFEMLPSLVIPRFFPRAFQLHKSTDAREKHKAVRRSTAAYPLNFSYLTPMAFNQVDEVILDA